MFVAFARMVGTLAYYNCLGLGHILRLDRIACFVKIGTARRQQRGKVAVCHLNCG